MVLVFCLLVSNMFTVWYSLNKNGKGRSASGVVVSQYLPWYRPGFDSLDVHMAFIL